MSKKKEKEEIAEKEEFAEEEIKETAKEAEESAPEEKPEKTDEAREWKILAGKLEKEKAELEKKLAEEADRYLRILAEFDNYKKRTAREKDEIYFVSKSDVVKKFLPVVDNLERAEKFSSGEEFAEGVKMIIRQFFETLDALGISEVPALNEPFDPNLHEAVFHDEREGVPENTVTEVLQKGYQLGDKVIRHAMVKVSN